MPLYIKNSMANFQWDIGKGNYALAMSIGSSNVIHSVSATGKEAELIERLFGKILSLETNPDFFWEGDEALFIVVNLFFMVERYKVKRLGKTWLVVKTPIHGDLSVTVAECTSEYEAKVIAGLLQYRENLRHES